MSRRRNHYKPNDGVPLTESNWARQAELEFITPVLCGRRDWSAATDKLEHVDCKACLRIIDEAQRRFEAAREERRLENERLEARKAEMNVAFQKSALIARVFRPRAGQA